ncbi:Os01g0744350, partial [Oryza sativa Japonica Group]
MHFLKYGDSFNSDARNHLNRHSENQNKLFSLVVVKMRCHYYNIVFALTSFIVDSRNPMNATDGAVYTMAMIKAHGCILYWFYVQTLAPPTIRKHDIYFQPLIPSTLTCGGQHILGQILLYQAFYQLYTLVNCPPGP